MSGIVKSVKKAFKRVAESKVAKGLLIAAATYYAVGLAGGAFGNETLANMPGIKGAADFFGLNETGAFAQGAPPGAEGLATTPLSTPPPITEAPEVDIPDAAADAAQIAQPQQPAPQAVPQASPQASGVQAPVRDAAPATAGTGDLALTKPGETKGIINSTASWFKGLSPAAQQILAGGAVGGASAMMQALAAKSAQEDAEDREERAREDKIRRGRITAFGEGAFKPKSGIINSVRG